MAHPAMQVLVGLLVLLPVLIVLIVLMATAAIGRALQAIRVSAKPMLQWLLTLTTALAALLGVAIIGGCADLPRTVETRIDDYGNLAVLECVGECIYLEFDAIVPAGAQ